MIEEKKYKTKYTWYNFGKSRQVPNAGTPICIYRNTGGSTFNTELGEALKNLEMIDVKEEQIPIEVNSNEEQIPIEVNSNEEQIPIEKKPKKVIREKRRNTKGRKKTKRKIKKSKIINSII